EALGLGDGQLAELGAGAGDGAAEERRGLDAQVHLSELVNQLAGALIAHVDEDDVLHDGGAQMAIAELFGEIRELDELLAGKPAARDGCADGGETRLALRR